MYQIIALGINPSLESGVRGYTCICDNTVPDVLVTQGIVVDDLEVDGEDGVTPGRVGVHCGRGGDPARNSLLQEHCDLGDVIDHVHCQTFHTVLL